MRAVNEKSIQIPSQDELVEYCNLTLSQEPVDAVHARKLREAVSAPHILAHLIGDFWMRKRPSLEGMSSVETTLTLVQDLVTTPYSKDPSLGDEEKESLKRAGALFAQATDWEKKIDALRNGTKDLRSLSQELYDSVLSLNAGQSLLIPFGWDPVGVGQSGHVAYVQIDAHIVHGQKVFRIRIINSGSGTQSHASYSDGVKTRICPCREFDGVLQSDLTLFMFSQMLFSETSPSVDPKIRSNWMRIYGPIIACLSHREVTPKDTRHFITAQNAGSCAWSSTLAVLRLSLDNKALYKLCAKDLQRKVITAACEVAERDPSWGGAQRIALVNLLEKAHRKAMVALEKGTRTGLYTFDTAKMIYQSLRSLIIPSMLTSRPGTKVFVEEGPDVLSAPNKLPGNISSTLSNTEWPHFTTNENSSPRELLSELNSFAPRAYTQEAKAVIYRHFSLLSPATDTFSAEQFQEYHKKLKQFDTGSVTSFALSARLRILKSKQEELKFRVKEDLHLELSLSWRKILRKAQENLPQALEKDLLEIATEDQAERDNELVFTKLPEAITQSEFEACFDGAQFVILKKLFEKKPQLLSYFSLNAYTSTQFAFLGNDDRERQLHYKIMLCLKDLYYYQALDPLIYLLILDNVDETRLSYLSSLSSMHRDLDLTPIKRT